MDKVVDFINVNRDRYIDEMKQRIAAFAGVDADRITISFRY